MAYSARLLVQIALCLAAVSACYNLGVYASPSLAEPPPRPIPDEPVLTPCAVVRCRSGTVCRVVFSNSCPICEAEARCVDETSLSSELDRTCTNQDYQESVLQETFQYHSDSSSFTSYECHQDSGDSGCPPYSDCVRGTCCLGRPSQPDPPFPVTPIDIESACAATSCVVGTVCRIVIEETNGAPRAVCISSDLIGEGIDNECRRQDFRTAIVQEQTDSSGDPISYNLVKCRGPLFTQNCPSTSQCVDDLRGGGTCCFGEVEPRPGTCPTTAISVCGGIFCDNDVDCPDTQKCCDSACGGKLCTRPVLEPVDKCGGCPAGQQCEQIPTPCAPPPICVDGNVCPGYECKPVYSCVPSTVDPICPLKCPPNYVCQFARPECRPGSLCSTTPTPQCVPLDPPPTITPCAAAFCQRGFTCRAVIPLFCNGCQPQAVCIRNGDLPNSIDDVCKRERYPESVLQELAGYNGRPSTYRPLRCRRAIGEERCPSFSDCVRDICCVGPQNTVDPPIPPQPIDIESACAATTCLVGTVCRVFIRDTNSAPQVGCVNPNLVGEGIDDECRRQDFRTAIVQEQRDLSGAPISYNLIKCRGPLFTHDCPSTSQCVDDLRGGGTCCFSKLKTTPGTCPAIPSSLCGGIFCTVDDDCPTGDKCCDSTCGGKLCTKPEPVDRCGGCAAGQTCVDRPFPCPPGRFCILALVPTCVFDGCLECLPNQDCLSEPVACRPGDPNCTGERFFCEPLCGPNQPCPPGQRCVYDRDTPGFYKCVEEVDPCGGCPKDQVCVDTQIRCVTLPCPNPYQCVPQNECNGCRPGQVCIDTGIRCVTTPCPTYQCVDDNQCGGCPPGKRCELLPTPCPAPPICPGGDVCPGYECKPVPVCVDDNFPVSQPCPFRCPPNYECKFVAPDCLRGAPCGQKPQPQCVPIPTTPPPTTTTPSPVIKPGTCPIATSTYSINSRICFFEITFLRPNQCTSDGDCGGRQKCCLSKCSRHVCLNPYY